MSVRIKNLCTSDLLILIIFMDFFRYYREGSHCEKCDQSCELCTGPGPESCRACPPPLLELEGTKLCVERCPHRFYQLSDICKQCHTSCQTCTGDGASTIVNIGFFQFFQFCVTRRIILLYMCLQMPRRRAV